MRQSNSIHTIKQRMLTRINDLYHEAVLYKDTANALTDKYCERILHSPEYHKLPVYMREYLRGYRDAKADALWSHMVFSYEVDGKRLSIESPEYKAYDAIYISENCTDTGCYIWRSDMSKLYTIPNTMLQTQEKE